MTLNNLNGHFKHEPDAKPTVYKLLELSPKVEYALLALLELASQPLLNQPLAITEIAAKQPIPGRYLEQIFTSLRRGGIIQSQRGSKGGFILSRAPWQITLLEIVALIEGDRKVCELGETSTPERGLILEIWQQANEASQLILSSYTLQDVCQKCAASKQVNPMYYI